MTDRDTGDPEGAESLDFERQAAERVRQWWGQHGDLAGRWLVFVGVIGLAIAMDQWVNDLVNGHLARVTAAVASWLLDLLGARAQASGTMIVSGYCVFEVIGECTAYYPCAMYTAAVLAYPARWTRRLLGIAVGIPLLLLINQGRLVSLCYIHRREDFETFHVLVWQSLIIFFTVMLWVGWLAISRRMLIFGLLFIPLFLVLLPVYSQAQPPYRTAVFGIANTITERLSPPTRIEALPNGDLWAYSLDENGEKHEIGVWAEYVTHLIFLNLVLLPALLLATPAPLPDRFRLLGLGLLLLLVVHVLSTIGLVRETRYLSVHPGTFHSLWLLRLIYISGQVFGAVLWALLTWRYWFPQREPAGPGVEHA